MATINSYLNFKGETEEAFNFYKSVFGGEFTALSRFRDVPDFEGCDGMKIAENELDKIMHVALPVGRGNVLMGTDVIESMSKDFTIGDNISLSLNTDSKEEADKLFRSLSDGANNVMPLADTFWGAYFGMLQDKFGIRWMINYDYNQQIS